MAPGSYELTFGDERQTQSTVGFFDGRMGTRKWRRFCIWKIMEIYVLKRNIEIHRIDCLYMI
jgi:hypothetical protein